MNFALHEAIRLVLEEGLELRWERHRQNAKLEWSGLEAFGLELVVPEARRLSTLTTVTIPIGVEDIEIRRCLLNDYNIEIAGDLGKFKGQAWWIGEICYSSNKEQIKILPD